MGYHQARTEQDELPPTLWQSSVSRKLSLASFAASFRLLVLPLALLASYAARDARWLAARFARWLAALLVFCFAEL